MNIKNASKCLQKRMPNVFNAILSYSGKTVRDELIRSQDVTLEEMFEFCQIHQRIGWKIISL